MKVRDSSDPGSLTGSICGFYTFENFHNTSFVLVRRAEAIRLLMITADLCFWFLMTSYGLYDHCSRCGRDLSLNSEYCLSHSETSDAFHFFNTFEITSVNLSRLRILNYRVSISRRNLFCIQNYQ